MARGVGACLTSSTCFKTQDRISNSCVLSRLFWIRPRTTSSTLVTMSPSPVRGSREGRPQGSLSLSLSLSDTVKCTTSTDRGACDGAFHLLTWLSKVSCSFWVASQIRFMSFASSATTKPRSPAVSGEAFVLCGKQCRFDTPGVGPRSANLLSRACLWRPRSPWAGWCGMPLVAGWRPHCYGKGPRSWGGWLVARLTLVPRSSWVHSVPRVRL